MQPDYDKEPCTKCQDASSFHDNCAKIACTCYCHLPEEVVDAF